MNWNIELLEHTPNGSLSCLDVAWAQVDPRPMFFVIDATLANAESSGLNPPRSRLLKILGSCWPSLRDFAPMDALQHLGDHLQSLNELGTQHSLHAAAAMGRLSPDGSEWDLAECGDTKIYRWNETSTDPVWAESMPADDHRVAGLLGSTASLIRSKRLRLAANEGFVVFTDGAYHALARHELITPQNFNKECLSRFDLIKTGATDDATMVIISPHS